MKIRLLAVITVLMAMMSSCIDEEEKTPDFGITTRGYVLQESSDKFTPYIFFTSNYTDFALDTIELSGDIKLNLKRISDYGFVTDYSQSFKSLNELSGKITIDARAKKGQRTLDAITLKCEAKDTLPEIELLSFTYDGDYIRAVIKEKKSSINSVGFIFNAFNKDKSPLRIYNTYQVFTMRPAYENGKLSMSVPFSSVLNLTSDSVRVQVYTSNEVAVYRESEFKTIARKSQTFEEDKE